MNEYARPQSDTGYLLQMQSFSTHDGEGIRTVLFLPGCPLRCKWCANPETWTDQPKLAFYAAKCTACGACARACPAGLFPPQAHNLDASCLGCHACARACPSSALTVLCQKASVADILQKVGREEIFYRHSGGGVTFSGGEPTYQLPFLRAIVNALCDRGIGMWMETCGYFQYEEAADILAKLEHIFFDLKCMDDALHRQHTGVSNRTILDNAARIHDAGLAMTVRVPCVKGASLTEENLAATAQFIKKYLPRADIELLPYHDLGQEKYRALNMEPLMRAFEVPSSDEMAGAVELLKSMGVNVVSYR